MDKGTFRVPMSMACKKSLETRLMNVVTTYIYESIESDIYINILKGLKDKGH